MTKRSKYAQATLVKCGGPGSLKWTVEIWIWKYDKFVVSSFEWSSDVFTF